jgi:pimeloyl-ACP methyl ester carboxylesterase
MRRVVLGGLALMLALASVAFLPNGTQMARAQPATALLLEDCSLSVGAGAVTRAISARCGVLEVPEDWADPAGRRIRISVAVLPATGPAPSGLPIFHFEGGPGGSAITGFSRLWWSAYNSLRSNHDIVLIDQRGTGRSTSLQCTEFIEPAFDDLAAARTPAEEQALSLARYEACLARLAATTDPAHYTTAALVNDTNAVRQALGYDRINIFGTSYGTWLAQFYLDRYGETVNAAILEGALGPWNEHVLQVGSSVEAALNRVFDLCASDSVCGRVYPNLPEQLRTVLFALERRPVTAVGIGLQSNRSYTVGITRDRFLSVLQLMLDTSSTVGFIPQIIAQATLGVYSTPAAILATVAEQVDTVSIGLFQSVICAESVAFFTPERIAQYATGALFGRGDSLVQDIIESCRRWRSAELDDADVAPIVSDRPVLILSGEFDPRTPVAFALETAARLKRSTLAIFPYQGHGILPFSQCAQQLVARFLASPESPLDVSCASQENRPLFGGAVDVQYVAYTDPGGAFRVNIPAGWRRQEATSADEGMAFFTSPPGAAPAQHLGIAIYPGMSPAEARRRIEAALWVRFGTLEEQATATSMGTTITEYRLPLDTGVYSAALVILPAGQGARALWFAAPASMFLASFTSIMFNVLSSLRSG